MPLEIKFGEKDYAAPMYENMKLKAKESGINLNLDKILLVICYLNVKD